jgi:hypothetical protein
VERRENLLTHCVLDGGAYAWSICCSNH